MDVWDYLRSVGFVGDPCNSENELFMGIAQAGIGRIDYGYEYQLFDAGWKDQTAAGFYLWSGLGDRQSYGLFFPCDVSDTERAKALVIALLTQD